MNRSLPTFDAAEARNKLSHFTVQGFDLNGIVQAGAGDGEEMENAIRLGVEHYIAFEPLTKAYEELQNTLNMSHDPLGYKYGYHLYKLGLDNFNGTAMLNVAAGDGKGSSLYECNWEHPEVKRNWNDGQAAIIGQEEIEVMKFATFVDHYDVDLGPYDTLQLDTQGNEMEILLGMRDTLKHFKYLCIELSEEPVYDRETPGLQIAAWLFNKGFIMDSPITAHNDTFFVRKDIKAESDQIYLGRC